MDSSSSSKKRKSKGVWDKSKFVSEEAQTRYFDSVLSRTLIAERGLTVTEQAHPAIWRAITRRGWGTFCAQPHVAVVPLVREFYANAPAHENGKVFVRGKRVNFTGKAINKLFNLPDLERDEYTAYIEDQIDYAAIIQELAVPGTEWKLSEGRPSTFRSLGLDMECKAWNYFLGARLMPVRHFSDVTKERAVLLYCIVTGKSLDVGRFISAQIIHCFQQQSKSLFFPSLITVLCVAAGVSYDANEETLAPMAALTDNKVIQLKTVTRLNPAVPAPQVGSSSSRNFTIGERMARLEDEFKQQRDQFQQMRLIQDYHSTCHTSIAEMMRQLAVGVSLDMTQFPSLPPYPGQVPQEEPGSSHVADGGGDDDETMDEEEI